MGFFAGGLLKKVSVSGGAPTTICDANNARGGSWSEEDLIVFAPSSRAPLSLVSAAGGTAEPLTVLDNEYGETTHRIPMFLPGGDAFLFLAAGNTRQDTRVVVYSLSSGERRVLVEEATLPRYSPSGHLLYVQGGASMVAPFDVERLELLGFGVPVLPVEATLLALSAGGTLVYLADEGLGKYEEVGLGEPHRARGAPERPRSHLHTSATVPGRASGGCGYRARRRPHHLDVRFRPGDADTADLRWQQPLANLVTRWIARSLRVEPTQHGLGHILEPG